MYTTATCHGYVVRTNISVGLRCSFLQVRASSKASMSGNGHNLKVPRLFYFYILPLEPWIHFILRTMDKSIGQIIEEELRLQERSISWFARQLNCNRQNVYNIFSRSNIDITLLQKISVVLRRNFFTEIYSETDNLLKSV